MCDELSCDGICPEFDNLVVKHNGDVFAAAADLRIFAGRRFHTTNVNGAVESDDAGAFSIFLDSAPMIRMGRDELRDEIARRCGWTDAVLGWADRGTVPNGLVRTMILNTTKDILNERGSYPKVEILAKAA